MERQYLINRPFTIGNKVMRNRIVLPPMETRMSTITGDAMPELIDYYEARAKGGCGMIIVENTYVDALESRSSSASSGLYSDHLMPRKAMLAEAIKDHGCLAVIQLSHGGRQASAASTGLECVAPSPIPSPFVKRQPRELTREEIRRIQRGFALAADRAKRAGFDGVEIHGAHGYLLGEFMFPGANRRADEYGGSFENRLRMPRETIEAVRQAVGRDFIVGFRISVDEFLGPQGLEPEEACRFVQELEGLLDYVHCSAGTYETKGQGICQPVYQPAGKLLPLAARMKQAVRIPVIAVGSLDFKRAEAALEAEQADLVAIGRQQICYPEFANKAAQGRIDDIRPCCRANEGCQSGFFRVYPMRCELNPAAGRERKYRIRKTLQPKRIVILGGGCAGLEAARVGGLMGHDVVLLERSGTLGGHMNEAVLPPFKEKTEAYFRWLVRQVERGTAAVILDADTSPERIRAMKPDLLLIAVGSNYLVPPFPGKEHALYADQVLFDTGKAGNRVVVIGGGLVGCEVALTLAETRGCQVTIVEMLNGLNQNMDTSARNTMLERIERNGIQVLCNHRVEEILPDGIRCTGPEGEKRLASDTTVIAMGLKADDQNAARYESLGIPWFRIGDCKSARSFAACTEGAWRVLFQLEDL